MKKSTSEFLELVALTPAVRVLEVSSHADDLSKVLAQYLASADGEFHLQLYPGLHDIPQDENVKSNELKNFSVPFKVIAREYAVVILRDILDSHKFPDRIVKMSYKALLNAAEIILVQKKESMSIEQMKEILEINEFRAINDINIFEEYHVVVGKKMHMWGNGL